MKKRDFKIGWYPEAKKYMCGDCQDTGYVGDCGPGRAKNREWDYCHCAAGKKKRGVEPKYESQNFYERNKNGNRNNGSQ